MQEKVKPTERKPYERKTKTAEQALAALMRYAARAERSSGDAMRLMRTWGVPESDRGAVLSRLVKDRFIDDERYAEAYVRDKTRLAGWGIYKIRSGLAAKGIAPDIIKRVLEQSGEESVTERLTGLLERKARTIKASTPYEARVKLIRFALSRGFTYDEVMEAVSGIMPDAGDE